MTSPLRRFSVVVAATASLAVAAPMMTTTTAQAAPRPVTSAAVSARDARIVATYGSKSATVRTLQSNLAYLGYFHSTATGTFGPATLASVKSYQTRHHWAATGKVTKALFDYIATDAANARSRAAKAATTMPRNIDRRCLTTGRVICADKTRQKVYYIVNSKLVLSADARFGRPALPTREGSFTVYKMGRMWFSSLYHVYMPYSMFFSGGEAVHYSADFAANGYGIGSHGCINIRDKAKVAYIYDHTKIGDKVVVYRSR